MVILVLLSNSIDYFIEWMEGSLESIELLEELTEWSITDMV